MPRHPKRCGRLGLLTWVLAFEAALAAAGCEAAAPPRPPGLSAVDREAIEAAFSRGDTNGDGKLSREEAQRFPEIAARFDEFDLDHDGFLSLAEFAAAAKPQQLEK